MGAEANVDMAAPVHHVDVGAELNAITLNGLSQTIWPRRALMPRASGGDSGRCCAQVREM